MNNNKLQNTSSAIFLAAVLVAGVFAISAPLIAYGQQYEQDYESYYPSDPGMKDKSHSAKQIQKANCDNKNINVNGIDQRQIQNQLVDNTLAGSTDDASIAGQELTPEEAFAALNGNGDPLINAERNILNVCFNDNDNELTNDFTGDQTQTGPTIPPVNGEEPGDACGCFASLDIATQTAINVALNNLGALPLVGTLPLVTIPAEVNSIVQLCLFLNLNPINIAVGGELALVNLIAAQITGSVAIAQQIVDCLEVEGIVVIGTTPTIPPVA